MKVYTKSKLKSTFFLHISTLILIMNSKLLEYIAVSNILFKNHLFFDGLKARIGYKLYYLFTLSVHSKQERGGHLFVICNH